jgi:class 3 adenylate cyclase
MRMECPVCGHANRSGARFCGGCAAALPLAGTCPACGTANPPAARFCDACGAVLGSGAAPKTLPRSFGGGRYEVKEFLGEGAKKRVYLAHDTRLGRDVALAVVKTEGMDEVGLDRVRREARAMGRLGDHPNVVTIYDIGDEAGTPFIVGQHMSGGSVADVLERSAGHRLGVREAVRIAEQICRALEHAHEHGVVHRDVKPGNVWLAADGVAKLGDFGLAVALDRSRLTVEGMMVGTVAYMAPEQAVGREVDARVDLYSLGAMLYEMVAGRPPFLGDDAVTIISQHINTAPVAPSWHNHDVPRALESLIIRLLEKVPEDRPPSAKHVRETLEAIGAAGPVTSERIAVEEQNPLDRLAGGVFVGREREMGELRKGLDDALSGKARLVMLVGEPGIGKTFTAEELATYARVRGAQVLWGRCYEGEGAPAYWPWVQIIRSFVHDRDPQQLISTMGTGAADIAQVVSEVRERLPGLPAPPALEPEQARFRLFDSITSFLQNASISQPLVLVLDDLHWADKPSLLLMQFFAREARGARVLVVGTYRDVELGRQHPLSQMLGELAREQLVARILLRGLAIEDIGRFVEMTSGRPAGDALVDALYAETEGNPFFVNEIVRLLVSEGRLESSPAAHELGIIPQSVREVVGRRLDMLSEPCNEALGIASVIGREFALDLLEAVVDAGPDALMDLMDEAVASRVLVEMPGPSARYQFPHHLVRQTLYEELTATRRARLHRRIGEALEELHGGRTHGHLPELAHHFGEAARAGSDIDKAVDYGRRAGDRAMELIAYEEAVEHYQRVLAILDHAEVPEDARRCELLLVLAHARRRAGEGLASEETFVEAAACGRSVKAPHVLAAAAIGLGGGLEREGFGIGGKVDERLVRLLEESLERLPSNEVALRSLVLGRLAVALYWSDERERRAQLVRESLELADQIGDPAIQAAALASRRYALWGPANVDERIESTAEVLALAEKAGDLERILQVHRWRIMDLLEIGDVDGVDAAISEHDRLARELRQPMYQGYTSMFGAMRALMDGRFAEAEQLANEAFAIGQRMQNQVAIMMYGAQMFRLWWEQGRLAGIEEAMKRIMSDAPNIPAVRCALVFTLHEGGRDDEAREELRTFMRDEFEVMAHDVAWLPGIMNLSIAAAAIGDEADCIRLYDAIGPYEGHNCVIGPPATLCQGPVDHVLGLLAVATGRRDDAERHLEAALGLAKAMKARPIEAHICYDYAAQLIVWNAPGDRERALGFVTRSLRIYRELGTQHFLERALALKLRAQGVSDAVAPTASIDAVAAFVERERPDLRAHASPEGTVAILFTDIEGSTAMTERVGDEAAQRIIRAHNAIVREHVLSFGGVEVRSAGDGFMLAFRDPVAALGCAVAIQRAIESTQWPEPLRLRAGVHCGEAISEHGDFHGRNVILAARIAAHASGGEILVSDRVADEASGLLDVELGPASEVELKGLAGTHRVHAVRW